MVSIRLAPLSLARRTPHVARRAAIMQLRRPMTMGIGVQKPTRAEFEHWYGRFKAGESMKPLTLLQREKGLTGLEIHANVDTSLRYLSCWGFDYDYTMVEYNINVSRLIFDCVKKALVKELGYPKGLLERTFDPSFAIRGLHYDKRTGYLLKLDQFGKVTPESVHRGRTPVSKQRIIDEYGVLQVTNQYREENLYLMADLFCLPEACLLGDVIQEFDDRGTDISPRYVWEDIRSQVNSLHMSGDLHQAIMDSPQTYLNDNPRLGELLERLADNGKQLFLLTNSPFKFVDKGMQYILGEHLRSKGLQPRDWPVLFDIVISSARKPDFYTRDAKFRRLDRDKGTLSFQPVEAFKRGEIYTEGGLKEFMRLTGTKGPDTLYMGDHVWADLKVPTQNAQWKTAAIIKEIRKETQLMGTDQFQATYAKLRDADTLIEYGQHMDRETRDRPALIKLKEERKQLRSYLKTMFNHYFGSVFRTRSHRTMFFFNVSRYADIYTSSVTNLLNYPLDTAFIAERVEYPHEPWLKRPSIDSKPSDAPQK